MNNSWLAKGTFKVFDSDGVLLSDRLFLNKIFEVDHPRSAWSKAIKHIEARVRRLYGKRATCEPARHPRNLAPDPVIIPYKRKGKKLQKGREIKGQGSLFKTA